jgi:hypothetical protein
MHQPPLNPLVSHITSLWAGPNEEPGNEHPACSAPGCKMAEHIQMQLQ